MLSGLWYLVTYFQVMSSEKVHVKVQGSFKAYAGMPRNSLKELVASSIAWLPAASCQLPSLQFHIWSEFPELGHQPQGKKNCLHACEELYTNSGLVLG